jgi:formiminotetrahydrofolate cyclodeaminase
MAAMDVGSLTIDEFLARLGSADPTPGGGCLAALAGAMAAAMLSMVCNLTVGKPQYADVEDLVQAVLAEAREAERRLLALANADAEAYAGVRDAYRLPRSSEDERAARTAAIEAAMQRATEVPLETAEAARAVVDLAARAAAITNVVMLGDVAVAAHLAVAAARGSADQAGLNIGNLSDLDFATAMRARMGAATDGLSALADRALEVVQARSSRA